MDSRGNIYADDVTASELKKEFGRKIAESIERKPGDAIPIENHKLLRLIAVMNRRQRRVYYANRKQGRTPDQALAFVFVGMNFTG